MSSSPPVARSHRILWQRRRLSILGLSLLCSVAFLWQLGSTGLIDETEPLFAEAARQMHTTGDWITPYFNGETRFDKPPLIYWLMASIYQLLGTNTWAVRLPSALSAIGVTGLSFYTLCCYGCPRCSEARSASTVKTAWISAAILSLTPEMIVWGRLGVSDMLLTGCMGAALLTFFIGYAHPAQKRWYLAAFIWAALAVLAKGPVGIVLPGLIIGSFLLYVGQLRPVLAEMPLLLGSGIFLLLTVPWYILVILANGRAYLDSFFGYHNFERFTSVVNNHAGPWYFYFLIVFVGFAPWSVWLPWAMARLQVWRRQVWQQQPRANQLGLFAFHWFSVVFLFFSVSATKLPSYVLPLMPAAAILVGGLWSDNLRSGCLQRRNYANDHRNPRSRAAILSGIAHVLLLLALAIACFYSTQWLGDDSAMPNFRALVQQSGVMTRGAVIWGGGAIASLILLWRHQEHLWRVSLVAMVLFVLLTFLPTIQLVDRQRQLPLRQIAATLKTQYRQEQVIQTGFKPSLVFYAQRPITYRYKTRTIKASLQEAWQQSESSVLLVGLPGRLQTLELSSQQTEILQETGTYQLVRVHKPF